MGRTADAVAVQEVSRAIPIVVAAAGDPVASGLIESLARPGGNVTGLSQMLYDLVGKRLELLKEMVPTRSRVAVFWSPGGQGATLSWKELQLPARQLGLQLHSLEVRNPVDFDKAFEDAIAARAGAVFIVAAPVIVTNLKQIAELGYQGSPPGSAGGGSKSLSAPGDRQEVDGASPLR